MILPKILQFFPPPRYLQMAAVGVDISDRSIKFVELYEKGGRLELGRFGSKTIPEGMIKSGEILKKEELSAFLKENLGNLGVDSIVLDLPEEKAFVGFVTLPSMPEENVRSALELQLDEHVPLAPEDVVFDYELLPRSSGEDHLDLVIVAFPKVIVESYRDVIRMSGLNPLVFEMEAQAMSRAILPKDETETVMIIDFGRTRTSFGIVSGGIVRFTSTVEISGEAIDKALAKSFNVDVFKAERIKKERGLVRIKGNEEIFGAILPLVSAIQDEIERYLSFWNNRSSHLHGKNEDSEVKKIYLAGGDSNLTGLTEYLSYKLKLPVGLANPWINITNFESYIPDISQNESLSYATALGLALRAVRRN